VVGVRAGLRRVLPLAGPLVALALAACGGAGSSPSRQQWTAPPPMVIRPDTPYRAVVHTNYGSFAIELFAAQDPVAVNNFVFLARKGFYDSDRFFRIIRAFMVQTGDPNNDGTGGPGYRFADELPPPYPYAPGIVAYANSGPNTNGSQFFICTGSQCATLNQKGLATYTEIGRVVSGMSVVQRIAAIPVVANQAMGGELSKPTRAAYITGITIQAGAGG
jgi:cyclophilin family peptidyl-prolyl cis-trans isomerase